MIATVLDLGKRFAQGSAADRLAQTVTLAIASESAGLDGYWLGEHHVRDAAYCAPEIVLARIGSATTRLRLGHAGVLLRYYSPLKIAEVYLTLEAAFPGRIDLGVCRGPGVSDEAVAVDLVWGNTVELDTTSLEQKLDQLVDLYGPASRGEAPGDRGPFPVGVSPPAMWILGSSARSVDQASRHRLPYGLMLFYPNNGGYGPPLMRRYREGAAALDSVPTATLAVSVLCARSVELARDANEAMGRKSLSHNVVGTPVSCAEMLVGLARTYEVDQIAAATFSVDFADHLMLVEALGVLSGLQP